MVAGMYSQPTFSRFLVAPDPDPALLGVLFEDSHYELVLAFFEVSNLLVCVALRTAAERMAHL
jgi:hypothetical protein